VLGKLFCFWFIGVEIIGYIENAISQTTVVFKGVVKVPSHPQTPSNIEATSIQGAFNQSEQFKGTINDYTLLFWCQ